MTVARAVALQAGRVRGCEGLRPEVPERQKGSRRA